MAAYSREDTQDSGTGAGQEHRRSVEGTEAGRNQTGPSDGDYQTRRDINTVACVTRNDLYEELRGADGRRAGGDVQDAASATLHTSSSPVRDDHSTCKSVLTATKDTTVRCSPTVPVDEMSEDIDGDVARNESRCSFFDELPRELRDMVYQNLPSTFSHSADATKSSRDCWVPSLRLVSKQFSSELTEAIGEPRCRHRPDVTLEYRKSGLPRRTVTCVNAGEPFKILSIFYGLGGRDVPTAVAVSFQDKVIPIERPSDILLQGNNSCKVYGASSHREVYARERMDRKSYRWDNFWGVEVSWATVFQGIADDIKEVSLQPVGSDKEFFTPSLLGRLL